MTGVDKIKEVRQLKHINGLSIREISRRTNLSRNTVRKILRSNQTKFTYHREVVNQPAREPIREIVEQWFKEDL